MELETLQEVFGGCLDGNVRDGVRHRGGDGERESGRAVGVKKKYPTKTRKVVDQ